MPISIIAVTPERSLITRDTLQSPWRPIYNSGSVCCIARMPDGAFVGSVGSSNALHMRRTLYAPWEPLPHGGNMVDIAVMANGTLLGAGPDKLLYTRASLTSPWAVVPNSGSPISVGVMPNGTILCAGDATKNIYTRATVNSNWVQVAGSGSITRLSVTKEGSVLGIGMNSQIYTRQTLTSPWVYVPNSGPILNVLAIHESDVHWLPVVDGVWQGHHAGGIVIRQNGASVTAESSGAQGWTTATGQLDGAKLSLALDTGDLRVAAVSKDQMTLIWDDGERWYRDGDAWQNQYQAGPRGPDGPQLKQLDVGTDGTMCAVTTANKVLRHLGGDSWAELPGAMAQVAVKSADYIFARDDQDRVYSFRVNGQWEQLPGQMASIFVGADGALWGSFAQQISRYSRAVDPIRVTIPVYTGVLLTGEKIPLPLGDHSGAALTAVLNGKTILSMDIPAGFEVAIFASAALTGEHVVIHAYDDSTALIPTLGGPIAAIQARWIEAPMEPAERVTLYAAPDCWGKKVELTELRDYEMSEITSMFGGQRAGSIKVPPGRKVTLLEGDAINPLGFQDRAVVYVGNVYDIAGDMDERVTMMRIEAT